MKYRKKPVVIEAFQMTAANRVALVLGDAPAWLQKAYDEGHVVMMAAEPTTLTIQTLEGPHICSENDWIIKGVADELYPCKPAIFAATYEKEVTEDQ